jgi:hypothetical protein
MAIYLHLQTPTMGPKEANRITEAYERALRSSASMIATIP